MSSAYYNKTVYRCKDCGKPATRNLVGPGQLIADTDKDCQAVYATLNDHDWERVDE